MKKCSHLSFIVIVVVIFAQALPFYAADPQKFLIPEVYKGKTIQLDAWLLTPAGQGPFATVILAHGCNGIGAGGNGGGGGWEQMQQWAGWLNEWGYAALILDSFSARGMTQVCNNSKELPVIGRAADIYAAATYLAKLSVVNSREIGALGDSHGAGTVIAAVTKRFPGFTQAKAGFAATNGRIGGIVALYPNCDNIPQLTFSVPALILTGSADDWASPVQCEKLINYSANPGVPVTIITLGAPVTMVVYPNATHGFGINKPPRVGYGHYMRYDPAATADAKVLIKFFFDRNL